MSSPLRHFSSRSGCDSSAGVSPSESPELVSSSCRDHFRQHRTRRCSASRPQQAFHGSDRYARRSAHPGDSSPDFVVDSVGDPCLDSGQHHRDNSANGMSQNVAGKKRAVVKHCRVCGDKALGYNFNVVTCESCKAFFRRNALKRKEFRCPYSNNCDVSPITRRFCQKCRLKKCFEVGMKKEWIMSEEARQVKRRRIEEKRKNSGCDGENNLIKSVLQSNDAVTSPSTSTNGSDPAAVVPVVVDEFANGCRHVEDGLADKNETLSPQIHQKSSSDDSITVTRSALISLIMGSKKDAGALFQDGDGYNSCETTNKRRRICVCTCTCGAKPPGGRIENVKTDRCTSTDNQLYCDPGLISPVEQNGRAPPSFSGCSSSLATDVIDGDQHRPAAFSDVVYPPATSFAQQHRGVESYAYRESSMYNNLVNAVISSEFCGETETGSVIDVNGAVFRGYRKGYYVLNDFERMKLDELIGANEILKEPIERFISDDKKDNPSLTDVLNLMDIAIRRIIKMCKRIDGFKNLCQDDQISLLKGGCMKLMLLRGVMSYDPDKDSWRGPTSHYIKVEVLKGVQGNVYEDHKRYLQSFEPAWRTNEAVMLMLGAITLFNADRPHVLRKDLIKNEQEMYYNLLKGYLDSIYPPDESRMAYGRLCQNVEHLHKLHDDATRVFLEVNLTEVEPLLVEIFDLHSQTGK